MGEDLELLEDWADFLEECGLDWRRCGLVKELAGSVGAGGLVGGGVKKFVKVLKRMGVRVRGKNS